VRQLTHKLAEGRLEVIDVPPPVLRPGALLVRNAYSVVSAGTEGSTVRAARRGLIGKIKERPLQARQALDLLLQNGPRQAYRTVMKKLDSYSPLGYSSAGIVLAIGDGVTGYAPGDKVACGGSEASHAEMVCVPQNLCVRLSDDAELHSAAYNSLGAIALQGVRQAAVVLGEACAVIGLGLLGQLTCLLLRAAGVRTIGVDVNPTMVEIARRHAADFAAIRREGGLAERIDELTAGIGVDAVIITAAASTTDPINFAGRIVRRKGRVVVVGDVPTGFDREPHFYRKELDLRMSCSYGPGRYDRTYEHAGVDYPVGYARWTERRNMEAFQALVHAKKVDLTYLTTHMYDLAEATGAYEVVTGSRGESHLGIVIKYDAVPDTASTITVLTRAPRPEDGVVTIGFIGAGSYASSHLLPNLPNERWLERKAVMAAGGLSSRSAAERFGFRCCTSNGDEILHDSAIDTVFVASRHDTHADYVIKALEKGKHVFVEKPLCVTDDELAKIGSIVRDERRAATHLMVGFNRRFSPLVAIMRAALGTGPMCMLYRINAGVLSPDSWIRDVAVSGGRIVGEVCHFVDLMTFLNGSPPIKVQGFGMSCSTGVPDTASIGIEFGNGSIGTISYVTNGASNLPKEYLEAHRAGTAAILKDFREVHIIASNQRASKKKLMFQDKGQPHMVAAFLDSIRSGKPALIPFEEIAAVTRATLRIVDSLRAGGSMFRVDGRQTT
jgi:polar amino acid transport system substrate-binding protein